MSICIEKLPHECGSSDALQVFADEETGDITGFCFSCSSFIPDPYGDKKTLSDLPPQVVKTETQIRDEIAEIDGYQTLSLPTRKLRAATLEKFGVKVAVSERDGKTPQASFWPVTKDSKLVGYHVKPLWEGGFPYNVGDTKGADLLNWVNAKKSGAYRLIITEGPEDMASVDRIYEVYGKDKSFHPAVVSLPHGVASVKRCISKHAPEIKRLFKEVILSFDNDAPGQAAVKQAMFYLPDAKSVILPEKDANACVVKGIMEPAYKALAWQSAVPKNSALIMAHTLHEAGRTPAQMGEFSWPFPSMNRALRGLRTPATIYIGGGVKMGKGEFRNEIAAHLIKEHNTKIFMASFEEGATKTYKLLASKLVGKIFHDPEREFDFSAYDKAGEMLKDHAVILDRYQRVGWDATKEDIKTAAAWGARAFFIDPITNFTNGVSPAESNTFLQGMAQEVAEMAADLNSVFFLFCHLKAPDGNISSDQRVKKYHDGHYIGLGNCPHEEGGDISSNQFAGSRGMMRSCDMMMGIEGNKDPDLSPNIRNIRNIKVLEDREFGVTGNFKLFWNDQTGKFEEI